MTFNRKRAYHETSLSKQDGNFGLASTLTDIKQRRPLEDTTDSAGGLPRLNHILGRMNESSRSPNTEQWQVAESKASKKRKRKQEVTHDDGTDEPNLRFSRKIDYPLRVQDLQELVLYALSDGVAPTWVAVRNVRSIQQAIVMMIPGLEDSMLVNLVSSINQKATDEESAITASENAELESTQTKSGSSRFVFPESIIPVKAPGDTKQAKVHSPLQAMLISPTVDPRDKGHGRNGKEKQFQPVKTPIANFVHTADELREAEYPIHPALFTNEVDAGLERNRRETTGQSSTGGWVDADVKSPTPVMPVSSDKKRDFITQDLEVYALDCEMVLTSDDVSSLARISLLDWHGKVIIDKYVKPDLPIKNYFTQFSGITPEILENVTTTLKEIQQELLKILKPSTIMLGHSLESDLNALKLTHPFIIDTSMIYPHPRGLPLRSSLKFLANKYLRREIQIQGANGHDSVEDARAVLDLVRLKCEKGPKWGTTEANGESIFRRLARSGRTSAIVEYGTPEKGFGKEATIAIGCQNDEEVVEGMTRAIKGVGINAGNSNFVWGRLRDLESARGWNPNMDRYNQTASATTDSQVDKGSGTANGTTQPLSSTPFANKSTNSEIPATTSTTELSTPPKEALESIVQTTTSRLLRIYNSLPPRTLFILYSGTGDMSPVLRLQAMQQQYRKEFKIKKWDELSVKWTDTEEQALRNAVEKARKGVGFVCIT